MRKPFSLPLPLETYIDFFTTALKDWPTRIHCLYEWGNCVLSPVGALVLEVETINENKNEGRDYFIRGRNLLSCIW